MMTAQAASKTPTIEVNGGGEIRHGGLFTKNPVFTLFREDFKKQLAKRTEVTFEEGNVDYIINYNYMLIQGTFYSLFPRGMVEAEVIEVATGETKEIYFHCAFEINDGGNMTLKKSCARKLARRVKKVLN